MNLQDIRDYVRSHMDLELEDLPDVMLDVFIREGSRKIEYSEQRWPFYERTATVATSPSTGTVSLASLGLRKVASVVFDQEPLRWISVEEYDDLWGYYEGRPTKYAEWEGSILLGPVPDQAYDLLIRGYRPQDDWVAAGTGAEPDVPEELHNTVALWALHRAYAQQEDPEMASFYRAVFDQELNEFGRRITEMPLHRPLVMGGAALRRRRSRPRYDWEVS